MIVKTDEIGATYYQIIDAPKTSVVLYQYNRIIEKGLQDGQYKEAVVFEITNSDTLISLLNSDLQKTKMLFGRHCFCKGQAGYQKVSKGSLELVQEKNSIQFNLDFQVTEVPQLIKSIKIATK